MLNSKRICAIILAAGSGKRMGANVNKQFLSLGEKPVLYHTLKAFHSHGLIDSIIVVAAESETQYVKEEIVEKYNFHKVNKIATGGSERQHSVYKGLMAAEGVDIVLIHDGARPFVSHEVIENGIAYAGRYGASACGVVPKDTIKVRNSEGFSINTPERKSLFAVQTPQCFKYDLIRDCHERIQHENIIVTDDTMVVERYGHSVYLYDGSYENIKITTSEDMHIAEMILKSIKY